jgi:hypothetical protein
MVYLTDIRDFVVDFFISCTTDVSYFNKQKTFVWVSLFKQEIVTHHFFRCCLVAVHTYKIFYLFILFSL